MFTLTVNSSIVISLPIDPLLLCKSYPPRHLPLFFKTQIKDGSVSVSHVAVYQGRGG